MRNSNWRERFQNFMEGRYGQDELSHFLLVVTLIVIIHQVLNLTVYLSGVLCACHSVDHRGYLSRDFVQLVSKQILCFSNHDLIGNIHIPVFVHSNTAIRVTVISKSNIETIIYYIFLKTFTIAHSEVIFYISFFI